MIITIKIFNFMSWLKTIEGMDNETRSLSIIITQNLIL